MIASFLLSLREGLEAALVVGIVLGVLSKLKRSELNNQVWLGVGVAAGLSFLAALILNLLGMEFEGVGEEIFEGVTMLLAAGVLTWMIFWMHQTSRNIKSELENKTRAALHGGRGVFALAFLAVFREGIELALFLLAAGKTSTPIETLLGALLGLAGAAGLGWLLFNSTHRLDLRMFFRVTNVLLIIFAAGLVGIGVHEFNEAGLIPAVVEHVWDVNWILSEDSQLGMLLKALVGYSPAPSLTQVAAYLLYMAGIGGILFAQRRQETVTAPALG